MCWIIGLRRLQRHKFLCLVQCCLIVSYCVLYILDLVIHRIGVLSLGVWVADCEGCYKLEEKCYHDLT
jgi:hypothetical protein